MSRHAPPPDSYAELEPAAHLESVNSWLLQTAATPPAPEPQTRARTLVNYALAAAAPVVLMYMGLVAYALVGTSYDNKPEVHSACGSELWVVTLVNLLAGTLTPLLYFVLGVLVNMATGSIDLATPITFVVFLSQCVAFIALESLYAHRAGENPACTALLTDASFTGTPLLLHLAYVNIACNALAFVAVGGTMCSALAISRM